MPEKQTRNGKGHSTVLHAGVWLGIASMRERMDAVAKILNLPDNVEAFSIFTLGYPAEQAHLDCFGELPDEKVILADGTDATEEVLKAERWLIEHSF